MHPETEHSFDDAYKEKEEMYGKPYQELQDYFEKLNPKSTILDLGCGQGRDALFLAKLGFDVTAVDISEVGVKQMLESAKGQDLYIEGIVADVLKLDIKKKYDVILFDMILHAFEESKQMEILKKYANNLHKNGLLCIVFPDDMKTEHFTNMLNTLSQKWKLKDEIVIRDVPKIDDEETDFTFMMIVLQRSV